MDHRVVCDKCNTEHRVPADKLVKPAKFRCKTCSSEIVLLPGDKGVEVRGGSLLSPFETSVPTQLGNFHDLKRLASGGMGDIYLAKMGGAEGFEREVVLKVLHPNLAQDETFARTMVDEAKITVRLHHPNIVQVFNLERSGNLLYCVMEYVDGLALSVIQRNYRRKGARVPIPMALFICAEALEGLAYAHEMKDRDGTPLEIVHRDVSPHNIMVTRDGWVKLIDFGIAKAASRITQTQPGMVKGKFAYMAPEQLQGRADVRSDIFSMGVVLWETLAGVRLFFSSTDVDTLQKLLYLNPPPISMARPDIPVALDRILVRALEKNPEERFQTAREFKQELMAFLAPATADELRASVDITAERVPTSPTAPDADVEISLDLTPAVPIEMHDARTRVDAPPAATPPPVPRPSTSPAPVAIPPRPVGRGPRLALVGLLVAVIAAAGVWMLLDLNPAGGPANDAGAIGMLPPVVDAGLEIAPVDAGSQPESGPDAGTLPDGGAFTGQAGDVKVAGLTPDRPAPLPPRITLDRTHVAAVLRRRGADLQRCADKHLAAAGQGAEVQTTLTFTIADSGRVTEATLAPPALAGSEFGRCLLGKIRGLRFPRHRDKSVTISFPLRFQAMGP